VKSVKAADPGAYIPIVRVARTVVGGPGEAARDTMARRHCFWRQGASALATAHSPLRIASMTAEVFFPFFNSLRRDRHVPGSVALETTSCPTRASSCLAKRERAVAEAIGAFGTCSPSPVWEHAVHQRRAAAAIAMHAWIRRHATIRRRAYGKVGSEMTGRPETVEKYHSDGSLWHGEYW